MENIDYKSLALQLLLEANGAQGDTRYKTVPSSTPSTIMGHGPGGLFSTPGLSKALFSAMILPRLGLAAQLAVRPTNETNPVFGIITGVTASTGQNPTGVCDDPPVSGVMKLCNHSFVFGRYARQSRVFDLDRAGRVVNRGEFQDFQVFGNPLQNAGGGPGAAAPLLPGMANINNAAINEVSKALWEFGVSWSRDFAAQMWNGNPTNNTAGGGYKEFYGLDALINTGYRDAETGNLCAAADSIIYSFANVDISTNASLIIRAITSIMHRLKFISSHANLDPVTWKIAMPMSCFYALTELWPIAYATYRAGALVGIGSSVNMVDSMEMERMRDDMRGDFYNYTGQYLLIDGVKVPVIIDDTIPEVQNAGSSFNSTIYFVPFTVLGGEPVTYLEYFNYDIPGGAIDMARVFAPADSFYTTDAGRFLWHKKPPTNFCVQVLAKTEPRLLMLTPYLAARLTDVRYTPFAHERSWDPTNTSYWVDGGRYTSPSPNPSYLVVPG